MRLRSRHTIDSVACVVRPGDGEIGKRLRLDEPMEVLARSRVVDHDESRIQRSQPKLVQLRGLGWLHAVIADLALSCEDEWVRDALACASNLCDRGERIKGAIQLPGREHPIGGGVLL